METKDKYRSLWMACFYEFKNLMDEDSIESLLDFYKYADNFIQNIMEGYDGEYTFENFKTEWKTNVRKIFVTLSDQRLQELYDKYYKN